MSTINREQLWEAERNEILTKENDLRWVMFPIEFPSIYDFYKLIENVFWSSSSLVWNEQRDREIAAVSRDMLLLMGSALTIPGVERIFEDELIYSTALNIRLQVPEARAFTGFQSFIEVVHRNALKKITQAGEETGLEFDPMEETHVMLKKCSDHFNTLVTGMISLSHDSDSTEIDTRNFATIHEILLGFTIRKALMFSSLYIAGHLSDPSSPEATCLTRILRDNMIMVEFFGHCYKNLSQQLPVDEFHRIVGTAADLQFQYLKYRFPQVPVEELATFIDVVVLRIYRVCNVSPSSTSLWRTVVNSMGYELTPDCALAKILPSCHIITTVFYQRPRPISETGAAAKDKAHFDYDSDF